MLEEERKKVIAEQILNKEASAEVRDEGCARFCDLERPERSMDFTVGIDFENACSINCNSRSTDDTNANVCGLSCFIYLDGAFR